MIRVYVAGPLTKGDLLENVHKATVAADILMRVGYAPFLPHATALWGMICPRPYEDWMRYDFEWLGQCQALLRLPGDSPGADREVAEAGRLNIPVFYSVEALRSYFEDRYVCSQSHQGTSQGQGSRPGAARA